MRERTEPLTESYVTGPAVVPGSELTVGDLLRRAAQRSATHPALRTDGFGNGSRREWTYAQLLADSEECARRLLCVFDRGDRVAVWADNRAEWVVLQFGAALAGMVLVTLNPGFRSEEARYVLLQSRARGCFSAVDYRGNGLAKMTRDLQGGLPELQHVFELDRWQEFMDGERVGKDLPEVATSDPVMIQYTSGTTGFPKGALLLHGRVTANAEQVAIRAGLEVNSVWLAPLPLFHAGGCVVAVLGSVARHATLVLMSAWSAPAALELVETERVAIINAVPTMLIGMLGHEDVDRRDLSSLKSVLAGGATVSADIVRRLQERLSLRVFIIFGQTECGPVATMTHLGDSPEDKQNTVGTPMPGFEVRIVDPETGETAPIDTLGEFVARGGTMAGYFENEEATQLAFDEEGWLHTGDLCAMDHRGYVRVEGRLRDMIIRGGENIYPREIEELLLVEPRIADAAVVGLADDVMGEVVAAFIVPASPGNFDAGEFAEALRSRLAKFKVPTHWVAVDELPRTPTGKVQKFVLRAHWESHSHPGDQSAIIDLRKN